MTNKTSSAFVDYQEPKSDAQFLNIVKTEINNLIGIDSTALDGTGSVNNQQADSVKSYVSQAGILCTDTGSQNTYVVNASAPFTNPILKTGTRIRFKTNNANTGASTIAAFGNAAATARKEDGLTALSANDIQTGIYNEFVWDGTYWIKSTITKATSTSQGIAYLQQNQNFTIKNNNGDINNYIEFPAQLIITNAKSGLGGNLIKRLNASWAAGNAGGLFSSTKAANTFYYCFAIINDADGSIDYGFDTSPIAANRPTGYTNYEYKGCFLTNGSSNIRPFLQVKNYFFLSEDVFEPSITTPSVFTTVAFIAIPKISNIIGMLNFSLTYTGGAVTGLSLQIRTTGDTTSNGRVVQYTATNGYDAIGLTTYQPMNNLGQIDIKTSFTSPVAALNLSSQGWIDGNINI